ncbi:hypothetical protein QJV33_11925, partial [Commensalibacter sp. TBRC 10068]
QIPRINRNLVPRNNPAINRRLARGGNRHFIRRRYIRIHPSRTVTIRMLFRATAIRSNPNIPFGIDLNPNRTAKAAAFARGI